MFSDSLSDKPLPSPKLLRTRKSTVDSPMDSNSNAKEKSTDTDVAKLITPAKPTNKSIALTKENISKLNTSADTPTRRMTRRSSVSESIESNSTVPKPTRMTRRSSLSMEENEGATNLKNSRMLNINEPLLEEKEENLDSSADSSTRRITRSITNSPSLISGTSDLKDFKVVVNKIKSPEINKSLGNIEEKNVVFAIDESVNDDNSSKPKYATTPGSVNKRMSIIEIEDSIVVNKNLNFSSTTEDENNQSVKDQSDKSNASGDDSLSVLVENIKSNINDQIKSPSILGTPKTSHTHNYKTPFKNIKANPQQFQSTPIPISKNDIKDKNVDLKSPESSKKSGNKVSDKSPKAESYSKSWIQPIVSKNGSPKKFIDAFGINKSQDIKKDTSTISSSPNQSKNKTNEELARDEEEDSYDSSESENELIETEAEEVLNYNSGDSRTGEDFENEEINDEIGAHDAIHLGSDDSDSSLEEEESENESFIVEDDEVSLLSANSEEHLECNDKKSPKKRKRILINDDSTDDEVAVKENNNSKSMISVGNSSNDNFSAKSKSLLNVTVAESDEEGATDTGVTKIKKIDKTITPKQSPVKELKSSSLRRKSVNEDRNIVGTPKSTSKNNITNLENDMLGKDSPSKSKKNTPLRSSLGGDILEIVKNNDTLSKNTPTKIWKNTPLRDKSEEIDESTKKMKTPTPRKSLLKLDIQSTEKSNKKTRTSILENASAEESSDNVIVSDTPNKNTSIKPTESPKKSAKKNQSIQIEYEAMEVDEDDEEMDDIVVANKSFSAMKEDEANESIKTPKRKSKLIRIDGSIEIEKLKIKSTPPKEVDLDNILEKCNEIIKQKKEQVDKSRDQYKAKQVS